MNPQDAEEKRTSPDGLVVDFFIGGGTTARCQFARSARRIAKCRRDFSTWAKDRLNDFVQGQDYVIVEVLMSPNPGTSKARERAGKDYHLALDTTKHVAMLERNEFGFAVRQYLIDAENAPVRP